jgi:hypothetical protein
MATFALRCKTILLPITFGRMTDASAWMQKSRIKKQQDIFIALLMQ